MQRVMITGGPGSGKSTLARHMGAMTALPVYHMDHIHWMPGWVERAKDDKIAMVREIVAFDDWIFEGNFSTTFPERLARAGTFIWLDLPVHIRFLRVVWRTFRDRGKTRPDMAPDCPEGFHHETLAFWRYIFRTRRSARAKLAALAATATHQQVIHLKSPSQVRAFLASLPMTEETSR
ncbi:MAG: DNA topology modulation protein FlaR [Pseudomonadota bacterium]